MQISYIHGFLSGSSALKATQLRTFLEDCPGWSFTAPDFPDTPGEAWEALQEYYAPAAGDEQAVCLVGSSMGGFFATLLQCRFGFRAALINPCIHPQEYFAELIGEHLNPVTGVRFELRPEMLTLLRELDEQACGYRPERTLVLLQSGDEVLDYRRAQEFYALSTIDLEEGGCHAYSAFRDKIPRILEFFQSC